MRVLFAACEPDDEGSSLDPQGSGLQSVDDSETDELLYRMAALDRRDPAWGTLRNQVVCRNLPLARWEALRYRNAGEPMDDLMQVATMGLINAVDRFDRNRGASFRAFVRPTIEGELKRHFRDTKWSVRLNRRLQEAHLEVRRAEPELTQRLGRTPTARDLAAHLRLDEELVRTARVAGGLYHSYSLNRPMSDADGRVELLELLGHHDHALDLVVDRDALHRALRVLPHRLRIVLRLRFVDDLSQPQIAAAIGVSQMQVSRLLTDAIAQLRRHMLSEQPLSPSETTGDRHGRRSTGSINRC
jgi:RNA polymerase sigma-B factor